jgi:hypothetical protein
MSLVKTRADTAFGLARVFAADGAGAAAHVQWQLQRPGDFASEIVALSPWQAAVSTCSIAEGARGIARRSGAGRKQRACAGGVA